MSDRLIRYKAITDLTIHLREWLDNTDCPLPHLPDGVAVLMAEQAFAVLTILELGEDALRIEGMLKDEDDE